MPVTDVTMDEQQRTMTVTAEFSAPIARLWNAYFDTRQIERFWAPPAFSARFLRHDAFAGGITKYEIYGEDDEVYAGHWQWESVVAPSTFTVTDRYAENAPVVRRFSFEDVDGRSRLTTVITCSSDEAFQSTLNMGVEAATRVSMGQLDQLLTTLEPYATEFDTTVQRISPHQVRVARLLRGPVDEVWDAHVNPADIEVWKVGQDGWSMPVCQFVAEPGAEYVMEWKNELGGQGFGIMGQVIETVPRLRLVLTEQFIGEDAAESLHEYTFTSFGETTLVTTVITYASEVVRHDGPDQSMAVGFEEAYDRLDRLLLAT